MKNILAFVTLVSATGCLFGTDSVEVKTHATTHYLSYYTQDLKDGKLCRMNTRALYSVYQNEEKIPAWVSLDIIKKYELPGYDVVPTLPARDSLNWNIRDEGLEKVLQHLVTTETMPLILAKRQSSTWCSFAGWAAAHMPSIAAAARQSQLDTLRAEIMDEYKSPCVAVSRSSTYKKTDGDNSLFPLLPQ